MKIVKYALLFTAVVLLVLQPAAAACTVNSLTKFVPLGSQIVTDSAFKQELDNADLSTLKSSTVNFQGTQYNNREVVVFHNYTGGINGEVGPRLATSLTSIGGTEDDYKDGIYLETSKGAMGFFIVFDTPIDISKATKAEPLSLNILGKRIDITSVTGGKTFAARVWDNEDKLMNVGDSFIVNSKTVTLVDVSQNQNTATISVRDKKSNIKKTITGLDNINGLDVEIIESHYSAKNSEKWALIVAGTYSAKQYSDGDAFVVPCGQKYKRAECKKDNPDWVWDIDGLTTNAAGNTLTVGDNNARPSIGVINDYIVNDFSDNPITVGGVYDFPQAKNPLQVKFFNLPAANYATLDISFKPSEDFSAVFPQQNSEPAILLEASESDAIKVFDGRKYTKTNKIWLSYNDAQPSTSIDVLYLNPADNTVKLAQTIDQTKSNYNSEIGRVVYGASGSNKVAVMKFKGNPASADDLHLLFAVKGNGIASGSDDIDVWLGGDGEFTSIGAQNPSEVKPMIEMNLPKEVLKGKTFDMQIIGGDNKLLEKVQIFRDGNLVATLSDNLGDYFTTKESFTENALGTYNYLVKGIDVDGNSASVSLTISVVDQVQQMGWRGAYYYPHTDGAKEIIWKGDQWGDARLGTKDENHRTRYGIVIVDPKSNGAFDRVELKIPDHQIRAMISVSKKAC